MARIRFINTSVDNFTANEAIERIDDLIPKRQEAYVVTPNLDHIVLLEKDKEFAEAYCHADLVLTDGKPLIWLSKWMGNPIKEKISGSDLLPMVCKLAADKGYTMFFLGAAEGIAQKAAENLCLKFPGLRVEGVYSPPYGFENDNDEMEKIFSMVHRVNPDILIAALGSPKQEKFIYRNRKRLGVPISLGLGASLDFEAGKVKRAPKWVSNCGFEWLYRVTQDPKRLAKRYWNDIRNLPGILWKYR